MSPLWRRRHEIALLALMLTLAVLVGFWFGRMSAPDSTTIFERGKAEGVALERARHDHSKLEFDTLKGEIEATRSTSESEPRSRQNTARSAKSGETATSDPSSDTSQPTAVSGANNR